MSSRARGKIWMAKDTDTLMTLAHLPNAMIAVQTGHCVETVQRKRSALGLPNYYAVRYGTWAELADRVNTWAKPSASATG